MASCITPPKTDDVIKEIHEGSCGFNMEPRSMVVRIIKQGYYWPSMHRDVARIIQDCEKCKEQSALRRQWKEEEATKRKESNGSSLRLKKFTIKRAAQENPQEWQGPHMIKEVYERELYKIIDASDHSLIQTAKGTNLRGDIGLETGIEDGVAL
ncbi:reverse transcriptase domain-containing protein [Tanacetum coccineum]